MTPTAATHWIESHRASLLDRFHTLLCIPSISTDPAHVADIAACADWLIAEMQRIGFERCEAIPTDGHPVVYGEWLHAGDDAPTLLIYAHYDVQPVDPLALWDAAPFDPTERDGKLYARGAVDDKVGVMLNLAAFEALLATEGRLPVNVKLMFEGEEETGSPNMLPFVLARRARLAADLLVICDGGFSDSDLLPKIAYTLRGIVPAEVRVTGPDHDLHSGGFGGVVHNPVHVVGRMIGALHDDEGRVQIPDFYAEVEALSEEELAFIAPDEAETAQQLLAKSGAPQLWADAMGSSIERITALPTCDINGVWGGYQGAGTKTIIPAEAGFKVTMRLVAGQDPDVIGARFKRFIEGFAVPTVAVEVKVGNGAFAATMLRDGPIIEAMQAAFERVMGTRATFHRGGGSVPIVGMFQRELAMPIAMLGLAVGGNGHAPNEYVVLDYFFKGIETALDFYSAMGAARE